VVDSSFCILNYVDEIKKLEGVPEKNPMTSDIKCAENSNKIHELPGAAFLNRSRQRSFSLNIFCMNALALMEASQKVKDPVQGFSLMTESNREAGLQAHRELNRHVHNFAASALTLVEHTRVFMRKHYGDTPVLATYEAKVVETFVQSPIAQFVQGLRNYMVHRGLPNSSMYLNLTSGKSTDGGMGTIETGVQFETASLLDWDKWNSVARKYLTGAGDQIEVHIFAHEYMVLVNQFNEWLDVILAEHHRIDVLELVRVQAESDALRPLAEPIPAVAQDEEAHTAPFCFTPSQSSRLDKISLEIFEKIRELNFKAPRKEFETERPRVLITEGDVVGPISHWGEEQGGASAYSFIDANGKSYGLGESDFKRIDELADVVQQISWARGCISRKFSEQTFLDWARGRFSSSQVSFVDAFSTKARSSVKSIEICAPIAHMEIERGFAFGPVRIEPVTSEFMTKLQGKADNVPEKQRSAVEQFFERLRKEIQGGAAVFAAFDSEPEFASERGLRIAQDAVGLLSFFAPAAPSFMTFNPICLMGASCVPSMKLIASHDDGSFLTEGLLAKNLGWWRLSSTSIVALQTEVFAAAASLVISDGLSEFALAVRASILNYTKGTILVSPLDRLRNSVLSLEGVLLKHDMEPRSHSVATRMVQLSMTNGKGDPSIATVVQQIYWLSEQPAPTEYGRRELELIGTFTFLAYNVLRTTLANVVRFKTKAGFIEGIERLGQSPSEEQSEVC
jgi:hypothetical protein